MGRVETRYVDSGGVRVFLREVAGSGPPTVFVHGNPTHSGDWQPFLEAVRGPAVAFDLPCFGRSGRPSPGSFDPSMHGYADHLEGLLDDLGINRYRLVVHDWGVVGLIAALRAPERLDRLVVINAVPLLPGYRWHWIARVWRRRGLGELAMATTTEPAVRLVLRLARPRLRPMPLGFVDDLWPHWDTGMGRAVLRLYRSADRETLAAAGIRLGEVRCPSLVVWGRQDPYLPTRFAHAYAERLPSAELVVLDRAGHWPWIDDPGLLTRVVAFLEADSRFTLP